jgi:hypothetical protein
MGASSNYSEQYDFSSGQDIAHKVGQEKSQLEASLLQALYGGQPDQAMAGAQRIRDLKRYLEQYGSSADDIEVIPRVRLAQTSASQSTSGS